MTETLLALVPTLGLPFLFFIVAVSCLGVPVPSSLALMAAGSFVEGGDLSLTSTLAVSLCAAIIGDQIGYHIGFFAGNAFEGRLTRNPKRTKQVETAKKLVRKWGGIGVYSTRWLLSPLGPTVNIICGASDMRWRRFTVWDILGEITWIGIYVGIGYGFSGNIEELAGLLGDASWALVMGVITMFLGYRLFATFQKIKNNRNTNI